MVQLGFSLPTNAQNTQPAPSNIKKSITATDFISSIEKNYGRIPNEQVDKMAEGLKSQGVNIIGRDQFTQAHNNISQQSQQSPQSVMGKIGTIAGVGLGTSAGVYGVGAALQGIGNKAYQWGIKTVANKKSLEQEGHLLADAKAEGLAKPERISDTAMKTKGIYGGGIRIEAKTKQALKKIWDNTIQPVFDKIPDKWSIGKLESEVKKTIDSVQQRKNTQGYGEKVKKAVSDYFGSRLDEGISSWNINQLNAEKKMLRDFLTKKQTDGTFTEQFAKEADNVIQKTFNNIIHKKLNSLGTEGAKASKAFKEYGNMLALRAASATHAESPLKSGLMGALNVLQKTVGVPIATAGGKAIARTGKAIKEISLIPSVIRAGKLIGKGVVKLGKGILAVDPIYTPDLLQHLPGEIGEAFKTYMNTTPAGVATQLLNGETGKSQEYWMGELKKQFPTISDDTAKKVIEGKMIII